jgi:steroid 5-alpha reductase family enzyme
MRSIFFFLSQARPLLSELEMKMQSSSSSSICIFLVSRFLRNAHALASASTQQGTKEDHILSISHNAAMEEGHCDLLSFALIGSTTEGSEYYSAFYTFIAVSTLTFVVSTVTRNYSQVDKLWSIVPFVYAWIAVTDQRTLLMAILATIWGIRLTANFARRGGYHWPPWRGDEDYRWAFIQQGQLVGILKYRIPWMIFNLTFISFYQNFLLMLIVAPSYVASTMAKDPSCNAAPLNIFGLDGLATVLMMTFIVIESIADNQQHKFQTEKYRQINAGVNREGDYADGFCQSGLFAIVRKPNYAAEQCIWISFYLFSVAATATATGGQIFNWSFIGAFLLVTLFQGSGWFTEKLTLIKYPVKYAMYQKRVPLYVPKLFGNGARADSSETSPLVTQKKER